MASPDQFLIHGIDPRGEDVISQNPFATNDHEAFHHYSRQVDLDNGSALVLPTAIDGIFYVGIEAVETAIFTVFNDGSVEVHNKTAGIETIAGFVGSGNYHVYDIANPADAAALFNGQGASKNFTVIGFYR